MLKHRNSVALCFDSGYEKHAMVVLTSLFFNSKQRNFTTNLLVLNESNELRNNISMLESRFNRKIEVKVVDPNILNDYCVSGHITSATYLKLFASDYIDADKILYLDCDLIVECDVSDLFEYEFPENVLISGVEDSVGGRVAKSRLKISDCYLNAGVLLINAEQWRIQKINTLLASYYALNKDSITWHDQCLLNGSLTTKKSIIPSRFNIQLNDIAFKLIDDLKDNECFLNAIFHFNSTIKPWHLWCKEKYRKIWDKYASVSPVSPSLVTEPKSLSEYYNLADIYHSKKDYLSSANLYKIIADHLINTKSI